MAPRTDGRKRANNMSARLRRLYADQQKIKDEFTGHPHIDVYPLEGDPPEKYRVVYRVPGLRLDRARNRPVKIHEHSLIIYLHQSYPREKPKCVMETEVFHPNIDPSGICIGDDWAAGETIVDIIIQIGQMLQYQNYNTRSPMDPVAARWAEQNEKLLPIGDVDLYQPDVEIDFVDAQSAPQRPDARRIPARPRHVEIDIDLN